MNKNIIENNTSRQEEENTIEELHEVVLKPLKNLWEEYPLALRETNQMLPDILKTSEQAGSYKPVVLVSFMVDIIKYYHCQKMVQLSKKEYKLNKRLYRLQKENHEFNKLSLSRGAIPDHIFQQVQELQKSEEQEASL